MKALMIGGTGVISTSVTRRLLEQGWEVTLLNRGQHAAMERPFDGNVRQMMADINDEARVAELLGDSIYDAVCDFIVFTPDQAARDVRLFLSARLPPTASPCRACLSPRIRHWTIRTGCIPETRQHARSCCWPSMRERASRLRLCAPATPIVSAACRCKSTARAAHGRCWSA